EAEIATLEAEIAQLQDPARLLANGIVSPQLEVLRTENAKLKFQATHLERNIAREQARTPDYMVSINQIVTDMFTLAIGQAYPDLDDIPVLIQKGKFADYQCNSAMSICQLEVAGPGFINVYLSKSYIAQQVNNLLRDGVRPPRVMARRRSISRLLEWVGHDVLRLNHLGDWGTQFGMLIAHLKDKFPNYLTVSPPISDLQAFYKESKVLFDSDEEFKKRAYSAVVKLQSRDPDHMKAWNLICDVSRNVYDRLGVTIVERGESFYQDLMQDVVRDLDDKGLTEMDDGRKIMFVEGQKVPLTLVKSDGGFTYDTSDMAAGTHFDLFFAAAQKAGYYNPNLKRVEHVAFGVVLGED
ncbi:SYRC-like protein, partial [Mya arenaria]